MVKLSKRQITYRLKQIDSLDDIDNKIAGIYEIMAIDIKNSTKLFIHPIMVKNILPDCMPVLLYNGPLLQAIKDNVNQSIKGH